MSHIHQDEITLTPFVAEFSKYGWAAFRSDAIAGLSIAMLTVPQAMAFALVAGLPVSCGIFSAIFTSMIVAIFGSSSHLIVGPGNAIAILIQAGISEILFTFYRDVPSVDQSALVLPILSQLALLVGLIQLLAGFFKLGRLTHFVSHSVIVGYLSGVALALVINQILPLLGMYIPNDIGSLFERSVYIFTHLNTVHLPTAAIGLTSMAILLVLKRLDKRIPAGALMLVSVAVIAYFVDYFVNFFIENNYTFVDWARFDELFHTVAVVGNTKTDSFIPQWEWPFFNAGLMNYLLPVSFAIALLGVMEATSASKSVAASSGQRLSTNQELFALGLGNFISAFIGAMPASGSASRTVISYDNGATTRLAAILHSLFVAVILFAFGFLIRHIPVAAFAALLIVSAASIVNFKQLLLCLKATSADRMVFLLTVTSCIFFSLDIAFYIGVVISISLYLKKAAVPQLVEFAVDESGVLHHLDYSDQQRTNKIRFIKVEGELFFGAADIFQSALKSITEHDRNTRVIILQLKNARDIDATSCLALQQLHKYIKASGKHLLACGLTHQIWAVLSDSGMIDVLGKVNLFIFDERHPNLSVVKAYSRANELIQQELPAAERAEESVKLATSIPIPS